MRLSGIRYLLFILLLAPVACSDEEALPDAPDTPEEPVQIYRPLLAYNTLRTEEKMDSDAQTVTARQTFSCTDGLLTQMVYEQSFTAVEPVTMSQTTTLTYLADKVIVTDSFGNTLTYLLNPHGYAETCTLETNGVVKRQYYFYYDSEYHLTAIEEYLASDNFETAYSRIVIKYYPDMIHLAHKVDQYFQIFIGTFNTNISSNNLAIPSPFLAELHPLSMHTPALYAQILGNVLLPFIQEILPDESTNKTTFHYSFDEAGIPTDCIIQTISNEETFNRKISYQID